MVFDPANSTTLEDFWQRRDQIEPKALSLFVDRLHDHALFDLEQVEAAQKIANKLIQQADAWCDEFVARASELSQEGLEPTLARTLSGLIEEARITKVTLEQTRLALESRLERQGRWIEYTSSLNVLMLQSNLKTNLEADQNSLPSGLPAATEDEAKGQMLSIIRTMP